MPSDSSSSGGVFSRWLANWSQQADRARRIVASDVTPVKNPVHDNQRVERTFTITKNRGATEHDDGDGATLRGLYVASPGLTVVRVRPEQLDEVGPDVLARVRISSDERAHIFRYRVETTASDGYLSLGYDHRRDTIGHLVAEVEVPNEAQLRQVTAGCRGDVVVEDGVLNRKQGNEMTDDPAQVPAVTALSVSRIHVSTPETDLRFGDFLVRCWGGGSVNVVARSLSCQRTLLSMIMGPGRVRFHVDDFSSSTLSLMSIGHGHWSFAANSSFQTIGLHINHRGAGSGQVKAPDNCSTVDFQILELGGGGQVDTTGVPSNATSIAYQNARGGSVRLQSPASTLSVDATTSAPSARGTIEYTGSLPGEVTNSIESESVVLAPASTDPWPQVHFESTTPTIRDAFENPVLLETTVEGYFRDTLLPALPMMLPSFLARYFE